jgi:hypothetical protein
VISLRPLSTSGSDGCRALSKNREKKRHNRGGRDDEGGSQGGSELATTK